MSQKQPVWIFDAYPDLLLQHWAILPEAFLQLYGAHEAFFFLGDVPEPKKASVEINAGGVGRLKIHGPLMPNPSKELRHYAGACCTNELTEAVRKAKEDPNIKRLFLDINSPGGAVTGIPELSDAVRDFSEAKPSTAFTRDMMASAAYWVGSQAREVVSTKSARVGSVGVIRPHIDVSKAREKLGVDIELFTAGKHKAAGAFNTKLTKDQREQFQGEVDGVMARFQSTVTSRRNVSPEAMDGRVFYGDEAIKENLVDKIVGSIDDAFAGGPTTFSPSRVDSDISNESNDSDLTPMKSKTTKPEAQDDLKPAASEPVEPTPETKDAAPNVESLQSEIATLENAVVEKDAEISGLVAQLAEAATSLAEANESLAAKDAQLASIEADIEARAEAKAKELAQVEAAKIAAQSGTDPVGAETVDADGKTPSDYAKMSAAELWKKCDEIKHSEGAEAARAFYEAHIRKW